MKNVLSSVFMKKIPKNVEIIPHNIFFTFYALKVVISLVLKLLSFIILFFLYINR